MSDTTTAGGPFYVYAYLNNERVIYVGQTCDLDNRDVAHRRARWWSDGLTREILGQHDTRTAALVQEKELIQRLEPEGNRTHNPNGKRYTGMALSMSAAARLIGIDRSDLKAKTDAGTIPYWFKTPGGRYMYAAETLEEHKRIAARRNGGSAA